MDSNLVLSSSTDSAETVTAAARNQEQQARVAAPVPELQQLDGSQVVSVEDEHSSRIQLERLLQEVDELTASGDGALRIQANEPAEESESEERSDTAAEAAAIPEYVHPEHPHYARMQNLHRWYGPEKIAEIVTPVIDAGIDVTPGVATAIAELPNGPEVIVHLCRDPWCPDGIVALNEMTPKQARRVLGEWSKAVEAEESGPENPQPVSGRSRAPAPIRPLGGSSTKSSVPPEEMSYQEYRKFRDRQEKQRYRR